MTWTSRSTARRGGRSSLTGVVGLLVVVWLIVGVIAANQRHYFGNDDARCSKVSTIAVTIIAGPLNYAGANPKIHCAARPSK